jgi:hypothetical protein
MQGDAWSLERALTLKVGPRSRSVAIDALIRYTSSLPVHLVVVWPLFPSSNNLDLKDSESCDCQLRMISFNATVAAAWWYLVDQSRAAIPPPSCLSRS